jgi:hypothetical protein
LISYIFKILYEQNHMVNLYMFFHGNNVISFVVCNQTFVHLMCKARILGPQTKLWPTMHFWLAFRSIGWLLFMLKNVR